MSTVELKKHDREIEFVAENTINDTTAQKKCFIAELVNKALTKFFDEEEIKINNAYSLYKLPIINEELNIIDFEINSLSVHVVPTIDRAKNINVYIPRIYRLYNYKPDIVLFVNFSKALTKMDITGFITKIDLTNLAIPKVNLTSADELVQAIQTISPANNNVSESAVNTSVELMLAFIENSLSEEGRLFFIKNLLNSKTIRKNYKLFYALNCDFISIAKEHTQQEATRQYVVEEEKAPGEDINIISKQANFEELIDSTDITENPIETISEDNFTTDIFENDMEETYIDSEIAGEIPNITIDDTASQFVEEANEEISATFNEELSDEAPDIINTEEYSQPVENITIIDDDLTLPEYDDVSLDLGNDNTEEFDLAAFDMDEMPLNPLEKDISTPGISNTQPLQNDEILPEIGNPVQNTVETIEELNFEQLVLDEASPESLLEQNIVQPILNEENNNIQNAEEVKADNEGDDIFDFLSDMAVANSQDASQNIAPSQEEVIPDQQPSFETNTQPEQQTVEQPQVSMQNLNNTMNMDMAFNNDIQSTQEVPQNQTLLSQISANNTKKKSPLIPALLIVLLAAGGYSLYMHKDTLLTHFNKSDDSIQGLAEEKDGAIPPPIDSAALDNSGNIANNVVDVPPPPATANNTVAQLPDQLPTLPNTVEPPKPKKLNDAIATALSKDYAGVRISKVSWEVSETLANNPSVSRYLTIAGKSIKNSLSQDLAAATEPSFKDNIAVTITYKKDGSVVKTEMAASSGSDQIDNIILKSVKDTLGFIKMPALNLNKAEYQVKLMIRL